MLDRRLILTFLKENKPFMIVIKNDGCHYCRELSPLLDKWRKEEKINLFSIDTERDEDIAETFSGLVDGVPSIVYYDGTELIPINEPEEPNEDTWYDIDQVKEFYNNFQENK